VLAVECLRLRAVAHPSRLEEWRGDEAVVEGLELPLVALRLELLRERRTTLGKMQPELDAAPSTTRPRSASAPAYRTLVYGISSRPRLPTDERVLVELKTA
jgi:hypothetical protein